jgi:hypothetical protein
VPPDGGAGERISRQASPFWGSLFLFLQKYDIFIKKNATVAPQTVLI